eukprot:TRINITY_DN22217_c0_g1_i2.p1 TRINITY_DN22217_c0_g1~~TRINITY_DN22217_c0_g1_i2.p1  ORF type:complete len:259 (+),score=36.94 TRINITY_DN22217_c0_g1_i2:69-845(+)
MATVPSEEKTGGYAAVASDVRGHCSWFLTRTNKEHQATMEHPFMQSIYAKSFDSRAYHAYLSGQYLVFSTLEVLCEPHKAAEPLSAVYDGDLHRSAALISDLRFWQAKIMRNGGDSSGSDVANTDFPIPSPATAKYLQRLYADSDNPWLLLCHHFLQYNAVLSGGQFLGKMVSAVADAESPKGAEFYSFPQQCQPPHGKVQEYIDKVDQLEISESLRIRMLECMKEVYRLLLAMMDESYAMAPVAGVTYSQTKAVYGI